MDPAVSVALLGLGAIAAFAYLALKKPVPKPDQGLVVIHGQTTDHSQPLGNKKALANGAAPGYYNRHLSDLFKP